MGITVLPSNYTTHEESKFSSQLQQNLRTILEVEVQDENSPNIHEEKSEKTLEND